MDDLERKYPGITSYVELLNSQTTLTAYGNSTPIDTTIGDIQAKIDGLIESLKNINIALDPESVREVGRQLGELFSPRNIVVGIGGVVEGAVGDTVDWVSGWFNADGTAHAYGTAHASGNWGLPQSEHDSLVGELGPEMVVDPRSGRYYTVGDNGAEMVDLPKGAIIFNHKQTESLLKHGYVTSRGKAYADGNAHLTIFDDGSSKTQWEGTGYSGGDDSTFDAADAISSAADSMSDAANEFKEVFDWIEVRLEEINDDINLESAKLENKVGYAEQNESVAKLIKHNEKLYKNLDAAKGYYNTYASKLLEKVDEELSQ